MEIDLGCPALALVTTQDTAGIFRRTSGTRVSGTIVVSISWGRAQYRVFQTNYTSFFVVSRVRSSRAAISDFLGCFFWQVLHLEHA